MTKAISEAILSATGTDEPSDAVRALGLDGPPTNQQILAAAQSAYQHYRPAVDAASIALANIISSGSMLSEVTSLDNVDWQSPGITASVTDPFYSLTDVQTAISASANFPDLNSFSVGVFSEALPGGGNGMVGFVRDVRGSSPKTSGAAVTLDIFKGIVKTNVGKNLQFGTWIPQSGSLHDSVVGFFIDVTLSGVNINLKIMLTTALNPYGFVVSSGAKVEVPVQAAVFAGTTSSPKF